MPRYDFRCAAGHVHEREAGRGTRTLSCLSCRLPAQRQLAVVGISGMVSTPTRYARINQTQFVEAQHTLVYEAEKRHIDIPDPLKVAHGRIKRGEVKAIA